MDKIISIIVPSYNMEAYLPKCLGSLVVDDAKLLQALDVIVVNDGSKDRTSEIAHEFERKYPGVFRVIDKENGHYGSCINAALKIAAGVYVKVLDADDWFDTLALKDYIEFVRECCGRERQPGLIVSDVEELRGETSRVRSYSFLKSGPCTLAAIDCKDGRDLMMHAIALKRSNLIRIGYKQLEGIIHTDLQWIHLPVAVSGEVAYFDRVVYKYYSSRPGNTSNEHAFYETYHLQEYVTRTLIEEYNRECDNLPPEGVQYLKAHLKYRVSRIYILHLLERNPLLKPTLVEFDEYLREKSKWLFDYAGEMVIGSSIRFHYVLDWRRRRQISLRRRIFDVTYKLYGKIRKGLK